MVSQLGLTIISSRYQVNVVSRALLTCSCRAESNGAELRHFKKVASSFFVNIFNNNLVLKLNQNVNSTRGAFFFHFL